MLTKNFLIPAVLLLMAATQPAKAQNFCQALDMAIKDYPNNFENIKGDAMPRDSFDFSVKYGAKFQFPDAEKAQVEAGFLTDDNTFSVRYPSLKDPNAAIAKYEELRDLLEHCPVQEYTAVSDEMIDSVDSSSRDYILLPFGPPANYDGIIVDLQLQKGFGFDADYNMFDEYWLSLSVYKQE